MIPIQKKTIDIIPRKRDAKKNFNPSPVLPVYHCPHPGQRKLRTTAITGSLIFAGDGKGVCIFAPH
jgi:hypothetical protein